MTKLIVNADDFGFCESVNYGIISAHKNGIVKSTTLAAGMPKFDQAISLLKENPTLGCGIHMTLSLGEPVKANLKTIVNDQGIFHRRVTNELVQSFDLEEVYQEFCAQIDKVRNAGVDITHLDSHHHVHTLGELAPVIKQIVDKYQLPIRGGFEVDIAYDKIVPLIDSFYGANVKEDYFETNIELIKSYECVDLMTHPAFLEEYLINLTSYASERMKEYSILTSDRIKNFLLEQDITITNYKDF